MEFSFEGYSLVKWYEKNKLFFIKNKDSIKSIIALIAAAIVFQYPDNMLISALFGAGSGYAVRFILDALDYALTENPK